MGGGRQAETDFALAPWGVPQFFVNRKFGQPDLIALKRFRVYYLQSSYFFMLSLKALKLPLAKKLASSLHISVQSASRTFKCFPGVKCRVKCRCKCQGRTQALSLPHSELWYDRLHSFIDAYLHNVLLAMLSATSV